ncbi:MAG: hypothetical protein OXN97_08560 [Bryobacterales bacterium]|nr:hypothetical protein [Bryobacterales bacterium]
MSRDLHGFLVEQYRNLGPISRVRGPGRNLVVPAGPEANLFMKKAGPFLPTQESWVDFSREVGAGRIVPSMNGPEHLSMREEIGFGYLSRVMECRIGEALQVLRIAMRRTTGAWRRHPPYARVTR